MSVGGSALDSLRESTAFVSTRCCEGTDSEEGVDKGDLRELHFD